MVNASKILTVSYGTFSCTLEGFDDPFSTMRSIAEYFRDLAADDRYFGAEPPTPDAEMLHRIAEREINRRVEARVSDNGNGVVLRQVEDRRATPAPRPAPSKPADTGEAAALKAVSNADAAGAAPASGEAADVEAPALDAAGSESVAQKLARIRAAVARSHVEPQFTGAFAEDEEAGDLYRARPIDRAFAPEVASDESGEPADAAPDLPQETGAAAETVSEPEADGESEAEDEAAAESETAIEAHAADEGETEAEDTAAAVADEVAEAASQVADETEETAEVAEDAAEDAAEEAEETSEAAAEDADETEEAAEAAAEVSDEAEEPLFGLAEQEETDEGFEPETGENIDGDDDGESLAAILAGVEAGQPDAFEEDDATAQDLSGAEVATDDGAEVETAEADEAAGTWIDEDTGDDAEDDGMAAIADLAATNEAEAEAAKPAPLILEQASQVVPEAEAAKEPAAGGAFDMDSLTARLAGDEETQAAPETETEAAEPEADEAEGAEALQAAAPAVRARIVKMSRTEFMERYVAADAPDEAVQEVEETDASEPEADAGDDVDAAGIRASLGETGLSPEDEDELVSELVAAEREAKGRGEQPDAEGEAASDPQAEAEDAEAGSDPQAEADDAENDVPTRQTPEEISAALKAAVEPMSGGSGDLAISRLLTKADSELKDNEGSRRRSAIAHLKAAVAAVRADGGRARNAAAAEDAQAMDEFRNDLARVVRPEVKDDADASDAAPARRAVPSRPLSRPLVDKDGKHVARPRRKMPPLMLVSEQRIDKPTATATDTDPVRPRRIQSEDEAESVEGHDANVIAAADDFGSYVEETGAEGVQELLEASAAFGTLVEGQPFNSRPQIMQRVLRHVPDGTVTREEGLRAFGVLLREGRLIRIQRGQFVLPEKSRFRTERKSATG